MEIIYHGHSFLEIKLTDSSIFIDPFIQWNPLCDISLDDVAWMNVKIILITHGHMDHIWDTPYIVEKTWAKVVSTYEVIQYLLREHDITNSYAMHIWWKKKFEENIEVKFVSAIHWWGVWPDLLGGTAAGILLKVWAIKIYHAWDTALTYDMKLLEKENIDVAFLPIGGNFTMHVDDALTAVEFIKPKLVVPIHYNTFETIKQDPYIFKNEVLLRNLANSKVLNPGDVLEY